MWKARRNEEGCKGDQRGGEQKWKKRRDRKEETVVVERRCANPVSDDAFEEFSHVRETHDVERMKKVVPFVS